MGASTSLLICTFFSSFLLFVHCQSQNNCIALSDCRTLFDLLKNRDNFANFTRVDVYKHLKNVNCGFDGRSPLVKCPDLDIFEIEKSIIDVPDDVGFCQGSLTIMHTDEFSEFDLNDLKSHRLTALRYRRLQDGLLKNRKVIHMESNGNCCWRVFEQKRFRGRAENIPLGFEGLPQHEPKSIKKVECDNI